MAGGESGTGTRNSMPGTQCPEPDAGETQCRKFNARNSMPIVNQGYHYATQFIRKDMGRARGARLG
jgi:hypothetical protein